MRYWVAYIKENVKWFLLILGMTVMMTCIMLLNGIDLREILYGIVLVMVVVATMTGIGYYRYRRGIGQLRLLTDTITTDAGNMKEPEYLYEEQYQECIRLLVQEKERLENELLNHKRSMLEYYSMWVHQIKTPIAALKLLLEESEDAAAREEEKQELFRIEQYVEMALQYHRLESQTNDLIIRTVDLDGVIKSAIHKYARLFIRKKLSLQYEAKPVEAVTDAKWMGFVIEQLLSNAIKYTKAGGVIISVTQERQAVEIVVEDTGVGIRAEDIPRVFENGYTGYNGHSDKKSTGIGLYLCRQMLDKLGHEIRIDSKEGSGTKVTIRILREHREE